MEPCAGEFLTALRLFTTDNQAVVFNNVAVQRFRIRRNAEDLTTYINMQCVVIETPRDLSVAERLALTVLQSGPGTVAARALADLVIETETKNVE